MINKIFSSNINKLHIMNSLEGLGWSLVGIFIPIYFLTLGFSLKQVFIYYIIQNIVIVLSSFLVVFLGKKISLQKILIIRFPFLLLFLILLYNLETSHFPLVLLAIIDGFHNTLFQLPRHILFSEFSDREKIGSSTGQLFAIPQFVTMLAPFIGGLITVSFGFKTLFIVASIFFLAAFIPILYTKILPISYDFKFREGIGLYKKYKTYFYAEIFNSIGDEIEGVIWPIFVYLSLINIASVGLVGSLLAISSALFTLYIGQVADKTDRVKMIRASVVFVSLVWILRFFIHGELTFYILTVLAGLAYVIFSVPYYSLFYEISKKEKAAVFFAFREIPVNIARIIVFVLGIILVSNLKPFFLVAAFVYIYFLFWKRAKVTS